MGINFSDLFTTLTDASGNLIYYLVVLGALLLTEVLALRRVSQDNHHQRARHVAIGIAILFLAQIILPVLRLFNLAHIPGVDLINPLVESASSALTIVWLVWTFFEHDRHFWLTGICIFLTLTVMSIVTAILLINIIQPEMWPIDAGLLMALWSGGSILLIIIGLILTYMKQPSQSYVAIPILIALWLGHLFQMTQSETTNLNMGAVRLAQILSLPWVIALSQRFTKHETNHIIQNAPTQLEEKSVLVDTKPTLVDQLLTISLQEEKQEKFKAVVRALCLSIKADVGYIASFSENSDDIQIVAGYDLIREEFLETPGISQKDLPGIATSWKENQFLTLSQKDAQTRDAQTLKQLLRYHYIGNILALPLRLSNQVLGGLIFLSPYTNKPWREDTFALFNEIENTLAQVLFTSNSLEKQQSLLRLAQAEIDKLLSDKVILTQALLDKEAVLGEQIEKLKQFKAKYQIEKVATIKRIDKMQAEIRETTAQVTAQANLSARLEQLETQIRQLTAERDQLKTELARAESQIREINNQVGQTGPIRLSLENQIISLDSVAANIRLQMAAQLQQKQIDLELINPDGRQMVKTDPELLQTVLQGLLVNAIQVSDQGSSIQLSQKVSFETGMLIIQVTDFGAGLTPAEQTAFFNADHESISGIGSIQSIRTAIRAVRVLNGKIWLKSKKDVFTTFRVQLPVRIID